MPCTAKIYLKHIIVYAIIQKTSNITDKCATDLQIPNLKGRTLPKTTKMKNFPC